MQLSCNLRSGNSEASGEVLLGGGDSVGSEGGKRYHIQETDTNWVLQ